MAGPLVLFAPGAGAPSASRWMGKWAALLGAVGEVVRFDYPYAREGRRLPDRHPVLLAAHRGALVEARAAHPGPVVLAGKSMGSRIGCHLALEEEVAVLICLGYPLVGRGGAMRSEVLLSLRTPVLFVQGTGDDLCPVAALEEVRGRMRAPSELHLVQGGNHSLEVGARELRQRGESQGDVDRRALGAIAAFLASRVPPEPERKP